MRQIILDTETTGIDPQQGHRIIEIGCLELLNRKLTGQHFHVYINPEREIEESAFKVHGISTEFLQDKPLFKEVAADFIAFVDKAELIIHNAPFDIGFLNSELARMPNMKTMSDHCGVLDTLVMAKKMHPGQRNSLDALCKRYEVDNSSRKWHGALVDAELLAFVYLAMTGGQTNMQFDEDYASVQTQASILTAKTLQNVPQRILLANEEECARHQAFIDMMVKKSGVQLWEDS